MPYRRLALILIIPAIAALPVACSSLGYYSQAIGGQLKLLHQRQPIDKLLQDNDTDPHLKDQLQQVQKMRAFALDSLQLPESDSYTSYAETGQDAVVWNVIAAPYDSLQPKTWCFPVAGCVPYRGYFKQENAETYAAAMTEEGFDVAVSPATAYSTLGWFDDPLLDTMLRYTEYRLAGVLFHELAHQRLYIKNDATFNESFASAVERGGIEAWLQDQGDEEQKSAWLDSGTRQRDFNALVSGVRQKLGDLYQSAPDKQTLVEQKSAIFAELRKDYQGLKASWNSYNAYDRWFAQDLNNAHFALHATYENGTAAFECLLQEKGRNFEAFYQAATEISLWAPERRAAWLAGQDGQSVHCAANKSMRP